MVVWGKLGSKVQIVPKPREKGKLKQSSLELIPESWKKKKKQMGNFPVIKYMGKENHCVFLGSYEVLESGLEAGIHRFVLSKGTRWVSDTVILD